MCQQERQRVYSLKGNHVQIRTSFASDYAAYGGNISFPGHAVSNRLIQPHEHEHGHSECMMFKSPKPQPQPQPKPKPQQYAPHNLNTLTAARMYDVPSLSVSPATPRVWRAQLGAAFLTTADEHSEKETQRKRRERERERETPFACGKHNKHHHCGVDKKAHCVCVFLCC